MSWAKREENTKTDFFFVLITTELSIKTFLLLY